ncbi:MAG TPA: hypothetical protein VEL74_04200 [Thermoanaerobaculia bacterium]|nr:hypothetical protein [Thermoanaerobaculia bacterium]
MKKNTDKKNRILGRRVARELSNEQLGPVTGAGYWTYTLLYPSDPGGPRWDSTSGPIWV